MTYQEILAKIKPTIKKAGDKLKEEYESRQIYNFSVKAKGEIVTKVDKIAEEIILSAIKEYFPDHSILSEETGKQDKESDYMWIVDPLDGTTNFAMKNPFFNTTVSLVHKGEIVIGLVYAPMFDEFYYAVKGEGAYLNDEKQQVQKDSEMETSLHAFCYGSDGKRKAAEYYRVSLEKGYQTRQLGAAALELARISTGILDSMVVPGANPWDVAAGALIVQEAGGIVTDLEGNKYTTESKSGVIAAANEAIYNTVNGIVDSL